MALFWKLIHGAHYKKAYPPTTLGCWFFFLTWIHCCLNCEEMFEEVCRYMVALKSQFITNVWRDGSGWTSYSKALPHPTSLRTLGAVQPDKGAWWFPQAFLLLQSPSMERNRHHLSVFRNQDLFKNRPLCLSSRKGREHGKEGCWHGERTY